MASSWSIKMTISSRESERDGYENRINEISKVQNNIPQVSRDYVTSINQKIENVKDEMHDAIKGIPYTAFFEAAMITKKESVGYNDSYLLEVSDSLNDEISDCNKKVQALNSEISQLWIEYYAAVEEENRAWEKLKDAIV